MTDKELVMNAIRWLPDDVTIHEISQELKFIASIRKGVAQIERDEKFVRHTDKPRFVFNPRF
ncbi:MAG: hypothetical protein L0Y58_13390 [Verrucomicrobia subdivision 3 bacterium]|nr:hypothetical protein [Limisphaerales bacterium]